MQSNWTTDALWFSNTPEGTQLGPPKNRGQKILAKRTGELRSLRMKTAGNSPNSTESQRSSEHSSFQRFSFQHFSFYQKAPLFPFSDRLPSVFSALGEKANS
jgi:hypothetical protein